MWPFILTRTVELEKTIVASKTDVLAILQNPDQLYAQNVMIMSVVQDASDPSWYTITDRLPLIGSWATHTTVRTQFIKTTDGCDTEVHANLWTRTSGQLRVRELESSEGTVLLSEKTVVKGLFLLMPYIVSTLLKGHRAFMNTVAANVKQFFSYSKSFDGFIDYFLEIIGK